MSFSIVDKRFRRIFVSFLMLSCLMPLLVVFFVAYQYALPLLEPFQLHKLGRVFGLGISTVLVCQVLGGFLIWWWVSSLENVTREIESISVRHLSRNTAPLLEKANELQKISALVQRLGDELQQKINQIEAYGNQIKDLTARLTVLASTDELTKLYNQRYFEKKLAEAVRRAKKIGKGFWLVRFEVDHLTSFGEKNSDKVLKELGQVVRKNLPTTALPFHLGRNEFAIILPTGDGREAARMTYRLSKAIADHHFRDDAGLPLGRVSVSCGIAGFRDNPDRVCTDAWRALTTAQRNGRPIEVAAAA